MNTEEIIALVKPFKPAIAIGSIPAWLRKGIPTLLLLASALIALVFVSEVIPQVRVLMPAALAEEARMTYQLVIENRNLLAALMVAALSVGLLGIGLNSFHSYYYLRGVRRSFVRLTGDITYEVAEVYSSPAQNLTSLIMHKESSFLIRRLGLDKGALLSLVGEFDLPGVIDTGTSGIAVTLGLVWKAAYENNDSLASYMLSCGAKKKSLYGTAQWMDRLMEDKKRESAWWWRENLSKIRGFAKTLSYGMTGYLSRFAREMELDQKIAELGDVILHQEECDKLEEALSKYDGSNAVLVGPDGSGRYTVTLALARAIFEGRVYSEIEHKRMFLLNAASFERINEKVELENTLITVFNEAVIARNIIFVVDDISKIVDLSKVLGVDFWSLIDPYIEHGSVSLVILTDQVTFARDDYKRIFEKRFEIIKMRDIDSELFLPYLEDKALAEEKKTGVFFTFPALETVANTLPVLFAEDAPLVKANTVINAIATSVHTGNVIMSADVERYLRVSTGVPLGKVKDEEKVLLLNLEDVLAKNVMGQKDAVVAVAKTMRRIRTGMADGGKPMGTFLFLGPTGSGKTETAKTLAKVFFGSEEFMSRVDMGEYSLPQSARRLLGDENEEGELSRLIHARPHGVLLLDEFEKSAPDVKDMFLRALDEGLFTDGQGRSVSLRTQIVIATSNAGSELIREINLSEQEGAKAVAAAQKRVVDHILHEGIFKPELVNRFDATVMFMPLSHEAAEAVTRKMLGELGGRIMEKGHPVVWEDDLVTYIVDHAQASEFGGRAIQRAIQDSVEDVISKKIIQGDLEEGQTITLSRKDLVL